MGTALEIRSMTADDLARAIEWAAAEGWNPGLGDREAFMAADPRGFLMSFLGGRPVSCISAVAYGGAFGFIGFYICVPEFRGRGHGLAIWYAGLARLGERTIGLDGVVAQRDNYRKSGFVLAHCNVRYGGLVDVDAPGDPRLVEIGGDRRSAVVLTTALSSSRRGRRFCTPGSSPRDAVWPSSRTARCAVRRCARLPRRP